DLTVANVVDGIGECGDGGEQRNRDDESTHDARLRSGSRSRQVNGTSVALTICTCSPRSSVIHAYLPSRESTITFAPKRSSPSGFFLPASRYQNGVRSLNSCVK